MYLMMTMSKIDDDYPDNQASMAGMRVRKLKTLFIDMGHGFNDDDCDNDDDDESFVALSLVHPFDGCEAWGICTRSCSNPHHDHDDDDVDVDENYDDDDNDDGDDDFNEEGMGLKEGGTSGSVSSSSALLHFISSTHTKHTWHHFVV